MRICLVAHEYARDIRGGIATQTHLKAHGLTSRGHTVDIISSSGDGEERTYQDRGVNIHCIPEPDSGPLGHEGPLFFLGYSLAVARKIYALEQIDAFDIIQFPEYCGEGFIYQLESFSHRKNRYVVQ